MKIRFLGQSGYVIRTEKTQLIIDPYLSDSVNRVAGRPRALPIPILPRDICCDAVNLLKVLFLVLIDLLLF